MKKRLYTIIILLLSVMLTGCGATEPEQENALDLSEEKLWRTDFTEYGDDKVRSINDICVIPGPLVRRETTYVKNDGDDFTWINEFVYEYDSENRYARIRYSYKNPESDEMELDYITTYSYDYSLYYVDTTYVQLNNIVTHQIYDAHGNEIFGQMLTSKDEEAEIVTHTYTYDYVCDGQYREEEYCYVGKDDLHHAMQLYNENGDVTYKIIQFADDTTSTTTTEYEYNEQKQIIHAVSEIDHDISNFKTTMRECSYTYDENGYLIREFIRIVEGDVYEDSEETIQYQYDEEGRMVRKEYQKTTYIQGTEDVLRESLSVTVYEYDLEPTQQSQAVPGYPVTPATSAYKNLLEQETFEWDEYGALYHTSDFQFALINSDNEADTTYLLLQNKESYAAAGTQHLLVYRDGEIKTLWGYGQNCIYIQGFTKDKETEEHFYLITYGGRQDATNFCVYHLEEDHLDLLAEYNSLERIFLDGSLSEAFYYWEDEEVSMQIFINCYNDLLDGEMTKVTWLDNTEGNRRLVFGE